MTAAPTQTALPVDDALARVAHELRGRLACILYVLQGMPSDGAEFTVRLPREPPT